MRKSSSRRNVLSSDEECNSSFVATSFFKTQKNTYFTPLQRKEIRDRAAKNGLILDKHLKQVSPTQTNNVEDSTCQQLPSKKPVKKPTSQKTSTSLKKTNPKPKKVLLATERSPLSKAKESGPEESFSTRRSPRKLPVKGSPKKSPVKGSPKKSPVKASPKKSPVKRSPRKSPSKKAGRKSPKKIARKGIKLYVQNWNKQHRKNKPIGGKKKMAQKTVKRKTNTKPSERTSKEVKRESSSGKASRGLNFGKTNLSTKETVVDALEEVIGVPLVPEKVIVVVPEPLDVMETCPSDEEVPLQKSSQRKRRMKTGDECLVEELPRKKGRIEAAENDERNIEELSNWLWSPEKSSDDSAEVASLVSKRFGTPESIRKPGQEGFLKVCHGLTSTPKLYPVVTPPTSPSSAGSTTPGGKKITRVRGQKLLKKMSPSLKKMSPSVSKKRQGKGDGMEQMTLDLGQKYFGAVTCETCGMVYTAAHPEDETNHAKFHRKFLLSIKFNGWKNETVLDVFPDGRIIVVGPDAPKYCQKKIEEVQEIVDQELGFLQGNNLAGKELCKTFLFIADDKKVAGCLIAEGINYGYRVIPDDKNFKTEDDSGQESQKAWCCETKKMPAVCGVSRIWVAGPWRRKKVATRLMDSLKNNFTYGTVLGMESIAFSDPTPDGKMFAMAYTKSQRFLVYKYK